MVFYQQYELLGYFKIKVKQSCKQMYCNRAVGEKHQPHYSECCLLEDQQRLNPEECDATSDDSSTAAGYNNLLVLYPILHHKHHFAKYPGIF